VTSPLVPKFLEAKTHPSRFQDEQIRKAVEALSLAYEDSEDTDSERVKRRKISEDLTDTAINLINEALNIPTDIDGGNALTESMFL
jgi:hypothetical protein